MTLTEIAQQWSSCTACRLGVGRTKAVVASPWTGGDPSGPRVLVIGEAPGEQEDLTGRAFCGRSGKVLREDVLPAAGFGLVLITNSVACRPPGNRDPKVDEKNACRPRLMQLVHAFNPQAVVTVGRHGTDAWDRLTKRHPLLAAVPTASIRHPAFLLRNGYPEAQRAQRMLQSDVAKLRHMIGGLAAQAEATSGAETGECKHEPVRVGSFRKDDRTRDWTVCARCGATLED